jgi:anti-anti-sigma factor
MTEEIVPLPRTGLKTALGDLEHRVEAALATGPRAVVLDMGAVERVSSTTVAMLLWARRRCAFQGVEVVLRHPSPHCREAIERTGLLKAVTIELPQ